MPKLIPSSEEASIVLLGSFNPPIYHPAWFAKHGLISDEDANSANVEITHREVSKFSLGWVLLQITQDRFLAGTGDSTRYDHLRDLVQSTHRILGHTPITSVGLNLKLSYKLDNEADWHQVGHGLAPKEIWSKTLCEPIGTLSLSIQSGRSDHYPGNVNVTVRPGKNFTVSFDVNSHIEMNQHTGHSVSKIIDECWSEALKNARTIADTTLAEVLK